MTKRKKRRSKIFNPAPIPTLAQIAERSAAIRAEKTAAGDRRFVVQEVDGPVEVTTCHDWREIGQHRREWLTEDDIG